MLIFLKFKDSLNEINFYLSYGDMVWVARRYKL